MKKATKLFIIVNILMVLTLSSSYAMVIHEETLVEEISPSISYVEKTQFNTNKWVIIKSLIVDISDDQTKIETLYNINNLRESKKLSELVSMKENIIGAINGDFFNSNQKTAIGPLIDQKKLIHNGIKDQTFNVFGITEVNKPFIGHIDNFTLDVTIGKTKVPISYINKNFTNLNEIVLLNNTFGENSIGNTITHDLNEIVIEEGSVTDIRINEAPVKIPEDGCVISLPRNSSTDICQFSIGDTFVVNEPEILNILDTLIGGGSILVEKGSLKSELSLPIKGNHPRSAIGYTQDYSKVILTTVEGRQSFVPGVTESELGQIMINLGAFYAINLDGGGSSTLIKRDFGKESYQTTNYLSDGTERRVYNGIGIASDYPVEEINSLTLELNQSHTIVKQPIAIDILGSDKYYNPITIDASLIELTSSLKGDFINGTFYPAESGKGIITVTYQGLSKSHSLEVHDNLAEIKLNNYHLKLMKDEPIKLKPQIITDNGYSIPIDLEQLTFDLPPSSYSIDQNNFILNEDIQDRIITLSYKDLKTELSLNMTSYDSIVLDDFEELKGKNAVYPVDLNGKFNLTNNSIDGSTAGQLFYEFTKNPTETRASYYVYNKNILMDSRANKITLDVFGSLGKNHWLRINIKDAYGTDHNLTLARNIDWQGWKTLKTEIPLYIKGPITIERIYIVETDFSNANDGSILLDNLRMEVPIDITLEKTTHFKDVFEKNMDPNYTLDNLYVINQNTHIKSKKFKIITNSNDLLDKYPLSSISTEKDYISLEDDNKLIIKLDNSNQTLNHNMGEQWLFFKEKILGDESQNLILYFSDAFIFKNNLEKELFMTLINEHHSQNDSNIFIITQSNKFNLTYEENFPIIEINIDEPFELRFNFFKTFAKFNLETQ